MALRGTDPESYITEYTSVYEGKNVIDGCFCRGGNLSLLGERAHALVQHLLKLRLRAHVRDIRPPERMWHM